MMLCLRRALSAAHRQLVILDADGQMHVTPRLSVVVDSNVATHTVVAKYDASKVDGTTPK